MRIITFKFSIATYFCETIFEKLLKLSRNFIWAIQNNLNIKSQLNYVTEKPKPNRYLMTI